MSEMSSFIVANLLRQQGCQTSMRFEHVSLMASRQEHSDSSIRFYQLCDGRLEADASSPTYIEHCKAMTKAGMSLKLLTQLIAGNIDISDMLGEHRSPAISFGNTLAVVDEVFTDGKPVDTHPWNFFFSVKFVFPIVTSNKLDQNLSSTQYLQISCPSLKTNNPLLQRLDNAIIDHIEIVTGVCIFSGHIQKTSLLNIGSSKVNVNYLSRAPATIQELESIIRYSSAIADMAAVVVKRSQGRRIPGMSIRLDIPSFHYYPAVVEVYEQGQCSASEALQWMDAVDRRHDQISYIFTSAIQHELQRRGVDDDVCAISTSNKINPFAIAIRQSMRAGKIARLEDVLQSLENDDSHTWQDFYTLLPEKEKPKDLKGLAFLFYVYAAVRSAFATDVMPLSVSSNEMITATSMTSPPRWKYSEADTRSRLIISVDDAVERRVYTRAQDALKKVRLRRKDLPTPVMVEAYVCRRALVNGNKVRARFAREEPTPNPVVLAVAHEDDGDDDEQARFVGPLDVVRELYGDQYARNLQIWSGNVGLSLG